MGGQSTSQSQTMGVPSTTRGVMICSLSTRRNAGTGCRVCSINELRVSVALREVFTEVDSAPASTQAPKKRRSRRQKLFCCALIMFHPRGVRLKPGRFHRRLPRLWGGWVLTCQRGNRRSYSLSTHREDDISPGVFVVSCEGAGEM